MSLSSALNIAASGLGATGLQAEVASRNIANADRPGFARKTVETTTGPSGEVRASAIERSVDATLVRLDRSGKSRLAADGTIAEGIAAYAAHLGQPSDAISPAALMEALKASVVTLSGLPGEEAAQLQVVSAAKAVARNLNELSSTLGTVAGEVELNIRYDVTAVNDALQELALLNKRVVGIEDALAKVQVQDRMSDLIDTVSEYMDVQTAATGQGMVNLYTASGAELVVRDRVLDIGYDSALGRLTAGKVDITPGAQARGLTGGTLSGLFALRDGAIPTFRAQLDGMAAALVQGFEAANPIAPGGLGLFTDAGSPYVAGVQPGLASRIGVNAALDRDLGGNPGLLQSGGLAGVPVGDPSRTLAMLASFSQPVAVDTAGVGDGLSLAELAPALVGSQQTERVAAEGAAETSRVAAETVSAARVNFQGVNIDDEMQKLLLIQQSYAANAKVLTTVSTMLDTLLAAV